MKSDESQTRLLLAKKVSERSRAAHYAVMKANFHLKGRGWNDCGYAEALNYLDACQLLLSRAKWLFWRSTGEAADFAVPTRSDEDLDLAANLFAEAENLANGFIFPENDEERLSLREAAAPLLSKMAPRGSEILWFEEAPIVPAVCPIAILSGSMRDMGRQYVLQAVEIFGTFVFDALTCRTFTEGELETMTIWLAHYEQHAPELVEMMHGMVDGAKHVGLEMTFEQIQFMWTGSSAPSSTPEMIGVQDAEIVSMTGYFGGVDQASDDDTSQHRAIADMCSAFAAWGEATQAGIDTVCATTTDHDCTFQMTIVAFPENANSFIFTPFSVNGSIPGVGRFFMTGHPGVNSEGLCYVHHGGPCGCTEPSNEWGYGLKRGGSVWRNLMSANSVEMAEANDLALPIGDDGRLMGSPGGFYADPRGALVIESRRGTEASGGPITRSSTPGVNGAPMQFLYANNNLLAPDSETLFCPPENGYQFAADSGWTPQSERDIFRDGLGPATRRMWAASSAPRNRYLHRVLNEGYGRIDRSYAESVYRKGADLDTDDWDKVEERMRGGENVDASTATRLNAFVSILELDRDAPPTYNAAIGPLAHRSVPPHRPAYGFYYVGETGNYWSLGLFETPKEVLAHAQKAAAKLVGAATRELGQFDQSRPNYHELATFVEDAQSTLKQSERALSSTKDGDSALSELSSALRRATISQVRSRQALQALDMYV